MAGSEPNVIRAIDGSSLSPPLPEVPGFEHFIVDTPGLQTHLAAIGEGEPAVLLHGFPQHWWQWRLIAPAIASAGYRVYCPDLRGAGWTVAETPQLDRETRLRDLLNLLNALNLERVHLVSHDMGAITALQLSYEYPQRIRTAVQLAVFPGFAKFHPKLAPAFQHLPGFIWHRPGASLAGTMAGRYAVQPISQETIDAYMAPTQRPEIDAAVRLLTRNMLLPEALRILRGVYRRRRLTVPTLIVYGREDHPTTEELIQQIMPRPERYADRVEFAYVDDAAHYITDDAPTAVAELSLDWFQQAG